MSNSELAQILLQTELASLRAVLDEIGAYIFTKDLAGRYTYVNRCVLELFGKTLAETIGHDDRDFFDLDMSDQLRINDVRVMTQGISIEQEEVTFVKPSGEKRIYWAVKKPVRDASGAIIGMCGISTDITERKAIEAKLAEQHQLLETILTHVDAHVYMKDSQRRFRYVNPKVAKLFGRQPEEVVGKLDTELMPQRAADLLWALDKKVFQSGKAQAAEESLTDRDGKLRHYWSVKVPIDLGGELPILIGFSSDITELHNLKEQLQWQSITDGLTGLFNRRHFFELAEKELARARRHRTPLVLLLLDIDHFKLINDSYGHPAGDEVLITIGRLTQGVIRQEDTLARVGGEEFAVLLPNTKVEDAEVLAERIRHTIAQHLVRCGNGPTVAATVSIGLAQAAGGNERLEALYSKADKLLYRAKNDGRNRVCRDTGQP